MNRQEQANLICALKTLAETCIQFDRCSLCPLGTDDNDCVVQSKSPSEYAVATLGIWRAVK